MGISWSFLCATMSVYVWHGGQCGVTALSRVTPPRPATTARASRKPKNRISNVLPLKCTQCCCYYNAGAAVAHHGCQYHPNSPTSPFTNPSLFRSSLSFPFARWSNSRPTKATGTRTPPPTTTICHCCCCSCSGGCWCSCCRSEHSVRPLGHYH